MKAMTAGLLVSLAIAGNPVLAQTALTPEQLTARIAQLIEASNRQKARIDELTSQIEEVSRVANSAASRRTNDNSDVMVETYQKVEELSIEMSELLGAIEQQGFEIEGIKKRQRELYLDIDRRLRDLESRAVSSTQAPLVSPPVEMPAVEQTATGGTAEQPADHYCQG